MEQKKAINDPPNKVALHSARKRILVTDGSENLPSMDLRRKKNCSEACTNYPVSAAEGDASHAVPMSARCFSRDVYEKELENISPIDASAGEICFSPPTEKHSGNFQDKLFILEEALENSHYDKSLIKSMLRTLRSYLEAYEGKEKQQCEKIKKLEKQLDTTSEFIQKLASDGSILNSSDSKKEVDSLRSNLVNRDAELLRIEHELENKTHEFNHYKSETSTQIHSLMRENESLHQELYAKKHRWKHPPSVSSKKSDLSEQLLIDVRSNHGKEFLSNHISSETLSSCSNSRTDCLNCSVLESQQEELLAGKLAFEATLKAVKEMLENLVFNRGLSSNEVDDNGGKKLPHSSSTVEALKPLPPAEFTSAGKKSVESQTIFSYNQLCQQYLDHFNYLKENIYKKVKLHEVKISELENDMEKQNKVIFSLQNQKKEFLKDVDQLKKKLKDSENEVMDLTRKWEEDVKNVENKHQTILQSLQSEIEQLNADLETEKENHARTFSNFEAIMQQQKIKVDKLNEANQTDLSIFKGNFKDLEAREKNVQNIQASIVETDQAIEVYKSQLLEVQTSYNNNIKSYSDQITKLDEDLMSASSERCELIRQLSNSQSELRDTNLKNEDLKAEVEKLVKSNAELEAHVEKLKVESNLELDKSQKSLAEANEKIEQLSSREQKLWDVFAKRVQKIVNKDTDNSSEKLMTLTSEMGNEIHASDISDLQNLNQSSLDSNSHSFSKNINDKSDNDLSEPLSKEDSGIIGSNASTTVLISEVKKELYESSYLNENITAELVFLRSERNKLENKLNQLAAENREICKKNTTLSEKLLECEEKLSHFEKIYFEKREYHPAEGEFNVRDGSEKYTVLRVGIEHSEQGEKNPPHNCLNKNVEENIPHQQGEKPHLGRTLGLKNIPSCSSVSSQTSSKTFTLECQNSDSEVDSLRRKIDELQLKLAENVPLESLQESLQQLIVENENLLKKDFERGKQTRSLLEREESLQIENRHLKKSNQELKKSIQELNLKNQKLSELMTCSTRIPDNSEDLKVEKVNLTELINTLKKENEKLKEGKNLMLNDLETLKSKKSKLIEEITKLVEQKEKAIKDAQSNSEDKCPQNEDERKSTRLSLPMSSSCEDPCGNNLNLISEGNKCYADFANLNKNLIVATSTPCPNRLTVNNLPVKICNFILEEDEGTLPADCSNKKKVPIEDLSHPYIISLECIGDCKVLRKENRKLQLEKHNLSLQIQSLQNSFEDTRSKLDQITQHCHSLEKKVEELESSDRNVISTESNDELEAFAIRSVKEERVNINSKIQNIEHLLASVNDSCISKIETFQDVLEVKEKLNTLLEYKCGSILRFKAYENKVASLKNEIKELWNINSNILSRSQLNVDELKLNIENNVFQVISDLQNQNHSADLPRCFELIDCLVREVKELKFDLIEKKNNLDEVLLKQSKLVSEILQGNVVENLQKINDENRLLVEERKKFLQILEDQEKLIHHLQNEKNSDSSSVEISNQHYQNIAKELSKQSEILNVILNSINSETTVDRLVKNNLDLLLEEKKTLELQLADELAQKLALQTRLDLFQDESAKKDQHCQELEKKLVRSEVEKEIHNIESKRNRENMKTLELKLDFEKKITKAKEGVNELESKVKTMFLIRNKLLKNCKKFQQTLCKSLLISEESLDNINFSDIIKKKKQYDEELAEFKSALSSEGSEIYETLKTKFENYSEQQIALAIAKLKKEHEIRMEFEIDSLNSTKNVETQLLEFEFENEKCEELSQLYHELCSKSDETENLFETDCFENIDNETVLQHFQKILHSKYISSIKNTIASWKNAVFSELTSIIKEASKLSSIAFSDSSLESQSSSPFDLKIENNINNLLEFHEEILNASNEFLEAFLSKHKAALNLIENNLKETHRNILNAIEETTKALIEPETETHLRHKICDLEKQKKDLEQEFELAVSLFRSNLDAESPEIRAMLSAFRSSNKDVVTALAQLRQELEDKHQREMVELRTYFERIMEKQFSEDAARQQSSNICFSGSDSENELYFGAGEVLSKYSKLANNLYPGLDSKISFKEKISDSEEQLEKVKAGLEEKYCAELNLLRIEHAETLKKMNKEMDAIKETHSQELDSLTKRLESEKDKWLLSEKEKLVRDLREEHSSNLMKLKQAHENQMSEEIQKIVQKMKNEENEHIKAMKADWERSCARSEAGEEFQKRVAHQLSSSAINKAIDSVQLECKVKELEGNLVVEQEKLEEFKKSVEEDVKKFMESQDRMIESITSQSDSKLKALKAEKEKEINDITKKYIEIVEKLKKEHNTKLKNQEAVLKSKEEEFEFCLRTQAEKLEAEHKRLMAKLFERQAIEFAEQEEKFRSEINSDMKKDLNDEIDSIKKERDFLKQISSTLRNVVNELAKYLISCEDELNKTLVDEILKLSETSEEESDDNVNLSYSSSLPNMAATQGKKVKRVHFAPDVSNIITQLNDNSFYDFIENKCDFSENIRHELNSCLERLKNEASSLLGLTAKNASRVSISSDINESLIRLKKIDLIEKLQDANQVIEGFKDNTCALEDELSLFRDREKALIGEIEKLKDVLASTEFVNEGYGENCGSLSTVEKCRHNLTLLQDKARGMMNTAWQNEDLQCVIDELCIESEKLSEESRRDVEDLQRQLRVAHERVRSTNLFLEEQAAERELEREEYAKECEKFRKQLHSVEQERSLHTSIATDMETLEQQLRECSQELLEARSKQKRCEDECKAALEKVWTLRDVVGDLEKQLAKKSEHEVELEKQLSELHLSNRLQNEDRACLLQKIKKLQDGGEEGALVDKIKSLQDQLNRHGSSDMIRHIKAQLFDVERTLVKQTRELENIHETTNSCLSSPSEEISIREQLERMNCVSPNTNEAFSTQQCLSPVNLPVDEATRLVSVVQRHCRAEEVAIKRWKDSEMFFKTQMEELKAERDILQQKLGKQTEQQAVLQQKFDQLRSQLREKKVTEDAEAIEKLAEFEASTDKTIQKLKEKEKQLADMSETLKKTSKMMERYKSELQLKSQNQWQADEQLNLEIETLKAEITRLKNVIKQSQENSQLMDLLVEDKNADIDSLQKELTSMKKQSFRKDTTSFSRQEETELGFSTGHPVGHSFTYTVSQSQSSFAQERLRDATQDLEASAFSPRIHIDQATKSIASDKISIGPMTQPTLLSPELAPLKHPSWITDLDKEKKITHLNSSLAEMKSKMNEKNTRIQDLESRLSRVSSLENDLCSVRLESQKSQDKEEELKKELSSLLETETNLKLELSKKTEEILNLKDKLSEKEEGSIKLSSDIQGLKIVVDKLQNSNEEAKTLCRKLEDEKNTLNTRLNMIQDENKNLKSEISRLSSAALRAKELEKEISEFSKLKETCESLQRENENLIKSMSEIVKDNKVTQKELGTVKRLLETSESMNQSLQKHLDELSAENDKLKQLCSCAQKELESIKDSKKELESTVQIKDADCLKLSDQIRQLRKSYESLVQNRSHQSHRNFATNTESSSKSKCASGEIASSLQLVQKALTEERCGHDSLKEKYETLKSNHQKLLESKRNSDKKLQDLKGSQNSLREKENDINNSNLQCFAEMINLPRRAFGDFESSNGKKGEGSVEDLTRCVQEELDKSKQLDDSLIISLTPSKHHSSGPTSDSTTALMESIQNHRVQVKNLETLLEEERKKVADLQLKLEIVEEISDNVTKYQDDRLVKLTVELSSYKERVPCLELQLLEAQTQVKQLKCDLVERKKDCYLVQEETTSLLEKHRIELNRITDAKVHFELAFQKERSKCEELQARINSSSSNQRESTNEQNLKVKLDQEQEKCIKLEVELVQNKRHLTVLKNMLDKAVSKTIALSKELDSLNEVKQTLERHILELKCSMRTEQERNQNLDDKIKAIEETDTRRQRRRLAVEENHKFALQRAANIQRELENECDRLRKELVSVSKLKRNLPDFDERISGTPRSSPDGDERLDFENAFKVVDYENAKQLVDKICEEHCDFKQMIGRLQESVAKILEEPKHGKLILDASSVKLLISRLDRSERCRRALIWQKRFLQIACNTHQENQQQNLDILKSSSNYYEIFKLGKGKKKQNKFKSVAVCCIFIQRLKYLKLRHSSPFRLSSLYNNLPNSH